MLNRREKWKLKMDKKDKNKKSKGLLISFIALLVLIVVVAGIAVYLVNNKGKEDEKTLPYTELIKEMSYGNIEKIEIEGV